MVPLSTISSFFSLSFPPPAAVLILSEMPPRKPPLSPPEEDEEDSEVEVSSLDPPRADLSWSIVLAGCFPSL